ncbi:T9SS type B sorting domain-containing protein [Chryseobacterium sp.]|uniref:T9SS type B sorting domain-containing protein n=1 Tax=Chryseobacterium sp. TaxID=1871047 RepID=UPI0011C8BF27|nr:T9SS type B sorting domain-containing protein [Chryseobacterium sp.]TXF76078.1 T9SS type B sorting domain-containing protein [Chryseobacterium sp.]
MKKLLFSFLVFCSLTSFAQTYQLLGNPVNITGWTLVPAAIVNTDFIQLTADQTSQFGVIKLNDIINLKYCDKWKVEFDFRIDGNGTTTYGKGDGFAFWYLANPPTSFTLGGGLGIPANSTGFMVGFDIFNNTTEGQMSKVHVLYGVNNTAGNNIEYNNIAGSTFHSADLFPTIPFQNASYRHVEVNGQTDPANPANWIVTVKIDNTVVVNQSFAPSGAAATMPGGYFGFSASTGAASARHSIKNVKVYVDKVPLLQTNITPNAPCPDPVTGISTVNLTTFNPQLTSNPANYNFTYYIQGNPTPITTPTNFQYTGTAVISVLIEDPTNAFCDNPDATINLIPGNIPKTDVTLSGCNVNGTGTFNLTTANVTTVTTATKKYFPTLADLAAGTNEITNPAAYQSAGGIVYVKITSQNCSAIAKITLAFFPIPVVNDAGLSACFIMGSETSAIFDLTSANVTAQSPVTKKYYPSLTDAQNGTNQINSPATFTSPTGVVYVRVINSSGCYAIAKITLTVIPPKKSNVLTDKIICIDELTVLDAGPGFTSYQWSTGATTPSIQNVSVGSYWVDLKTNNCITRQFVNVMKAGDIVITGVTINNSSATVNVSGGKAPYQYSVDGVTWQSSSFFTGLSRGEHTFYVKDFYNCEPVEVTVTVPNLINVITPDGNGMNDALNYSALSYKKNLKMEIFDRYGNKVMSSDAKSGYGWDGTMQGKKVYTGTYWYHIFWNEPASPNVLVEYTGWVLVKNRE